ncbi:MAG: N-6 DNA methylase [Flavobacteriales bacterium]|nr:N-6 DNA methylase [Flavobacteriales bacterium]MCB9203872.1 N-6 DNA methylase [Flavobacteriales bacterium]
MSLFQSSVLKKFLAAQEETPMQAAYEAYSAYFLDKTIQENIRNSKEEQFQEGFLRELFVKILGYTINPEPDFNLTTELKNIKDAKKTDGAILKDGKALAVVELKGTDTKDLDKITDQAFSYKNNQPECVYVVTSNFERLRFYIHDAVEHEEFNLFTLTYDRFKLLWLFLQKDNLLGGIPQKVKEESLLEEEKVTKRLYKDYSAFKNDLWQDMVQRNPDHDELLLYKKSQKLLDRFLFIFFAEDKGLLPPNSISQIVNQWVQLKELDAYSPLYDRLKLYFSYMNNGRKAPGKEEIHAYNGGLFKTDELLDGLAIDDELLRKHCLKLSEYDFDTEVDTNILGHIFEHSLNDIENVRAQLAGEEVDKSKTKRKKDGVFYTPKYITKYIVDNTVGKLCEEKKAEIGIDEEEFAKDRKGRRTDTLKKLDAQLKQYREWLLQLTICDPACGSGAFLNQALEFLMAEHRYVDELESQLLGYAMVFPDVENHILERNIYGVDINEESVEIARLSLWLRTAKKGRKLTSLSSNIKVGNSLIDDPAVAGELAFDWKKEFPTVFEKGGFDVVIGNPPYVVLSSFQNDEFEFLQNRYKTAFGRLNLFALFIEKSTEISGKNSKVGLIIPDSLCLIDYYEKLRKLLLDECSINQILELGDGIFPDATVPALVIVFQANKRDQSEIQIGTSKDCIFGVEPMKIIKQELYYETPKLSFNLHADEVFVKLNRLVNSTNVFALKDVLQIKIGICTGGNNRHLKDAPIFPNSKKVLQGRDINRYRLNWNEIWVNYDKQELLRSRDEAIFLKPEKLLMRQTSDRLILTYDNMQYYTIDSLFIIYPILEELNLKYSLALLNSKLLNRQYQKLNPETGRVFAQVKIDYVNELPIVVVDESKQNPFVELVDKQLLSCGEFEELVSGFLNHVVSKLEIDKPNAKLQHWPELDFKGFLAELKKAKVQLSLEEEAEWMQYFNKKKTEANALQAEIDSIDKQIDQMVYELYGLTQEEIEIVENA